MLLLVFVSFTLEKKSTFLLWKYTLTRSVGRYYFKSLICPAFSNPCFLLVLMLGHMSASHKFSTISNIICKTINVIAGQYILDYSNCIKYFYFSFELTAEF